MRIIIAGVPRETRDDFARRMLEQGRAQPAPATPSAPQAATEAPKKDRPKGKRWK